MRGLYDKRGLSPVIATVLLIMVALILAIIIFLWARNVVAEKIQKFDEPVENACEDVRFDAEAIESDGEIHIVNRGNVALYGVEVRKKGSGAVKTVRAFSEQGKTTITTGETESVGLTSGEGIDEEIVAGDEIIVVPVVLGETSNYKKAYVCDVAWSVETTVKV